LVADMRAVRADLLICVDQEGGRVQRLREGFSLLPALRDIRLAADQYPEHRVEIVSSLAWLMAVEVLGAGIDLSFAPVLDLDDNRSRVIGNRSFSPDPDQMVLYGGAYLDGMRAAGMQTTGKHFPGHGGVVGDSHHELPSDGRSLAQLRSHDLRPFAELMPRLDAMMMAHVAYPAVDAEPAGYSCKWIQSILRADLGFEGVVFSDDLTMEGAAGAGSGVDRARASIEAGCDLLLVCNKPDMALEVLNWLESEQIAPTDAAAKLRARKYWSQSEIMGHSMRAVAMESLHLVRSCQS